MMPLVPIWHRDGTFHWPPEVVARPPHCPPVRLPKAAKPSAGVLAPPATVTERLAGKDKLTPKESAAWLDDWLTRINSTP